MIAKLYGIEHDLAHLFQSAYDYAGLENLGEFRTLVADARFIYAVDVKSRRVCMPYGAPFMRMIADGIIPPQRMDSGRLVAFAVDSATDQIHKLCMAVALVKGVCELGD